MAEEDADQIVERQEEAKRREVGLTSQEEQQIIDHVEKMMPKVEADREKDIVTFAGAIPNSCQNLGVSDKDGNNLYTLVVMRQDLNDYQRALKKNGFVSQPFEYNKQAHNAEQLKMKEIEQNLKKLQQNGKITLTHAFSSVYAALVHMKIMRVFVDAVLRFGVPGEAKFFLGIIKPDSKKEDKKILQKLSDQFAEAHLKQMGVYGEKQDAQDEDFFPYVSAIIKNPDCLMDK